MPETTHVYDYVVIGGGTAGSVIASRLTENPDVTVAVIEGGPSDVGRDDVLTLRRWMGLLGGELDYDYPTTEQPRGNSHIRHSRARVLGGCSSHNTLIAFKPLPSDWDEWEAAGAEGWGAVPMEAYYARLKNNIVPVDEKDRNAIARDFVDAARKALEVPRIEGFNKKPFTEGVGFFDLAYHPEDNKRSSASVAYLHPVMDERPNLTLMLETWAYRLELDGTRAEGVHVRTKDGEEILVRARNEVVLCAGAVDSPRLLLHSGIGPREDLEALGIPVALDLPGVGENLLDHPESVIVWETHGPIPDNSAMDSDAGLFVRRDPEHAGPDLMFHFYQIPFTDNPERLGYERPEPAGPGLPLLHRRGRPRRPHPRRRHPHRPRGRRGRTVGRLAQARGLPRPGRHRRRGAERVRPQGRPHRLPPGGHLPDGRRHRRAGRRRPRAACARTERPARRRRLRVPDHARREPDDRRAHGRGARRRADRW
jgi:choline dehydrogenase